MSNKNFRLTGVVQARRKIAAVMKEFPDAVAAALFQEMQIERTESMRRTPVDTGTLKASHVVETPERRGRSITCAITVGGAAAPYAFIVHEDLQAFHRQGQAKFLESTLMESAPFLAQRVAARVVVTA